ncbi:MAG: hypothetical protein CM15mP36_16970 [Flavobacteriales bacterium]|nr:MAG: hypothetical protein CM15mP36_16970 [Flavobacteriales bacterium]
MDIVIKRPKTTLAALIASSLVFGCVFAKPDMYGNFPVTEKSYSGKKKDSTSYTGQVARHVLHNSLKKLAGKGNGNPNPELKATMMSYYSSKDAGRKIIDPTSKGEFKVKQTMVDEISKGKNLKGKTYKGLVNGFPGQMSGPEVFEFLIDKASSSNKGFDPVTGYNYPQLISKFMMGAVFYSQAVDNYLDEKMGADNKPNNKPYKKGAHYTGKEHSWDEAFGYFGAPAHAMALNAKQAYGIAKRKDIKVADANGDGVVDLKTEMTFAHAYYAADSDKAGTKYMHTIVDAFIKGRQLIRDADGAALTDEQRAKLMSYVKVIKTNWERVIAEAAFKYAGSCYKDLEKLRTIVESNGNASKAFAAYGKHWGELKGFLMALETSGRSLGEAGVRMNRLVGYGPVLLGGGQVTGIDSDGNFLIGGNRSMGEYQVHMVKLQKLLGDTFKLKARKNDVTGEMDDLLKSLGSSRAAEND